MAKYDSAISPFNSQDEFALPNFSLSQVCVLLEQYTNEMGQAFAPEVIEQLHKQTAGQPFLVNRMAQILTAEMGIGREETISAAHFEKAHKTILNEKNVLLDHLRIDLRRNTRFKTILMDICSYDAGFPFNLRNEYISTLASYGVLKAGVDRFCEIANPIFQYCIVQIFQPLLNCLDREYLPENSDAGFFDYLTPEGSINMRELLANFRDFINRAGYRILQVTEQVQELVGQYLLFAYFDQFAKQIHGFLYVEVSTGRGRMDLIILHQGKKYIIETKIWEGQNLYRLGKRKLVGYLKLEGVKEGYYVMFDHRQKPQARFEKDIILGTVVVSYCIPVLQQRASAPF
jgi:hypothetical protein